MSRQRSDEEIRAERERRRMERRRKMPKEPRAKAARGRLRKVKTQAPSEREQQLAGEVVVLGRTAPVVLPIHRDEPAGACRVCGTELDRDTDLTRVCAACWRRVHAGWHPLEEQR